jgi:hypothetical protein
MRNTHFIRGGVAVAALALAATACGSSGGGGSAGNGSTGNGSTGSASAPASPSSSMSDMGASAGGLTNTAAAQLYAGLDQLLREHVDLTANVVQTAITKGPASANTKQALAALDQNTQGLGAAIGSVYGAAAQKEFLKQWRAHIGFFVNYTLADATNNAAKKAKAMKDLAGYVSQFSTFVAGATKLPAAAVAADLKGHITTLETAIDAIVAGSPKSSADLLMAEDHMAGTAAVLAKGIASSMPSKFTS